MSWRICYLLWIFYEKFLDEVFGRLWNWWKCFFWIIHVNLRYIKVSFLIVSSHKRRFLCKQHVWNYTYVPGVRTQCKILRGYLSNIASTSLPPPFVVLQIKLLDVCHTQRIKTRMWSLSSMRLKHGCMYTHEKLHFKSPERERFLFCFVFFNCYCLLSINLSFPAVKTIM